MYKIAILGCENSHADSFLNFIVKEKKFPDVEVVGVYTDEEEANKRMSENFGVYCAKSFDEFVGKIDGVIITARDGKNHYKYAKPYISSGIPMFIDKPITSDEKEAVAFMKELKAAGCRITGGSICPLANVVCELSDGVKNGSYGQVYGGYVRGPVSMVNSYGNFFFYAQHVAEVTQKIFGYYPKRVKANVNGAVNNVVVSYDEYNVDMTYVDGNYSYCAFVSGDKGLVGENYTLEGLSLREMENIYALLKGAEQEVSYKQFIAPVFFMDAVARSIASGKEELVHEIEEI
jgi:predicted dehydrogenase